VVEFNIYLCDCRGFLSGKMFHYYIDIDIVQSSDLVDGNFVHLSNMAGSSAADLGNG
jgi:hypothetical protein